MSSAQHPTFITKAEGTKSLFLPDKVRRSLLNAGATPEIAETVIGELCKRVYPDMSTHAIYKIAFSLLKKLSRPTAARYHLKQAIFELGPSGFPFEQYVAALFRHAGFSVATNQVVPGHCVKHEVDIVALRQSLHYIIECKYHQQAGTHCDVKIPLYIHARFRDIEQQSIDEGRKQDADYQPWLVTNTRFTPDALQYGQCAGLHLMSWDFPAGRGLKDIIDRTGLYPVTCLTTLSRHEKQSLLSKGIVLCRSLAENPAQLQA